MMIKTPYSIISVDVETTGLDPRKDQLHGICIGWDGDHAEYYPHPVNCYPVRSILADHTVRKIFHNAPFDLEFLRENGYEVNGPIECTLLLAREFNENTPHDLKYLSQEYLGEDSLKHYRALMNWLSENKLKKEDLVKAPYEMVKAYGEEDGVNTYNLYYELVAEHAELTKKLVRFGDVSPSLYYAEESQRLIEVLVKMNRRGCRVDLTLMEDLIFEVKDEITRSIGELNRLLEKEIRDFESCLLEIELGKRKSERGKASVRNKPELWSFNWSSPEQVGKLFCNVLNLPQYMDVGRTPTGRWQCTESVFKEAVQVQQIPQTIRDACSSYLHYKKQEKLLGTYLEGIKEKIVRGRSYPQFLQGSSGKGGDKGGTVSGRLSSRNPNFQNLPRDGRIKQMFIPDSQEYCFVYADYSQLELRIAAHLSQDKKMMRELSSGGDIHTNTAKIVFNKTTITKDERQLAKTLNFALIYGAGAFRLQGEIKETLGIEIPIEELELMRTRFFEEYHEYADYLKNEKRKVSKYGFVLSHFGKLRRLPDALEELNLNFQAKRYMGHKYKGSQNSPTEDFFYVNKLVKRAVNQAYNFPVQSFGASLMKRAMIKMFGRFDIVTQVHDSIIVQAKKNEAHMVARELKNVLETIYPLSVPLIAEPKILKSLDEGDLYEPEGLPTGNLRIVNG